MKEQCLKKKKVQKGAEIEIEKLVFLEFKVS